MIMKKNLESIICYGICVLLAVAGIFVYKIIF